MKSQPYEKVKLIKDDLAKQLLSPRIFLGKCQMLDRGSKDSIAFQDNTHLPFYYYLGKYLPSESVINVGFGIGLPLTCYMMAESPVYDLCVQQSLDGNYYHPRLGLANLLTVTKQKPRVFVGLFTDQDFHDYIATKRWGSAIICGVRSYDEALLTCESLWQHLDGFICLEGVTASKAVSKAFDNFCTLINRDGYRVASRYGHGILFK